MRPDFTAQKPRDLARTLADDPMWVIEHMSYRQQGRMPRPLQEYSPKVLDALWNHFEGELLRRTAVEEKRHKASVGYNMPYETGDEVADEWEAAIARGETPDYSKLTGRQ